LVRAALHGDWGGARIVGCHAHYCGERERHRGQRVYTDIDGRLNLDVASLRPSLIIADVIPNPPRIRFVRGAEACGCHVLDGLGMIVNQGIIGIRYWTGVDVEASVMRTELENLFAR
jgi:shikimate dehydrogenase